MKLLLQRNVDKLGRITVGPDSAGSMPGPACYGRGGTEPTVTDADLEAIFDLMKWGPTGANSCPARFRFIRSPEAKETLRPILQAGNVDKTLAAPVTALIGYDLDREREAAFVNRRRLPRAQGGPRRQAQHYRQCAHPPGNRAAAFNARHPAGKNR